MQLLRPALACAIRLSLAHETIYVLNERERVMASRAAAALGKALTIVIDKRT